MPARRGKGTKAAPAASQASQTQGQGDGENAPPSRRTRAAKQKEINEQNEQDAGTPAESASASQQAPDNAGPTATATGGRGSKRKASTAAGKNPPAKKNRVDDNSQGQGADEVQDKGDDDENAPVECTVCKGSGQVSKGKANAYMCAGCTDTAWKIVEEFHVKMQPAKRHEEVMKTSSSLQPLTKREVDAIVPKKLPSSSHSQVWSIKHETKLRNDWEQDPDRDAWMILSTSSGDYIRAWKVFLRLFRCSPLEEISPKNHSEYHDGSSRVRNVTYLKDGQTVTEPSPLWSAGFAKALAGLAHHPIWQGKVKSLIAGLQFAAIVRTNDSRPWPLSNPTGEEFFYVLIQAIAEHQGQNKSMRALHTIARKRLTARDIVLPHFSQFMRNLESAYGNVPLQQGNGPYQISTTDLTAVGKALNDMEHLGFPLYAYPADVYGQYAALYKMSDTQPDKNNIKEYHERSILAVRRWDAMEARKNDLGLGAASIDARVSGASSMVAISRSEYEELRGKATRAEQEAEVANRELERANGEILMLKNEISWAKRHQAAPTSSQNTGTQSSYSGPPPSSAATSMDVTMSDVNLRERHLDPASVPRPAMIQLAKKPLWRGQECLPKCKRTWLANAPRTVR